MKSHRDNPQSTTLSTATATPLAVEEIASLEPRTRAFGWGWRWRLRRIGARDRRIEWSIAALSFLVALAFVPQILNFARRDHYVRDIVFGAWLWQPLEAIEYRLYDARFTARGPIRPRSADKIAIVAIDQSSLRHFQEWPWPRERYAQLIGRLKTAGARVIAVDIDFSDYQFPVQRSGQIELSRGDRELVQATQGGDVLFASQLSTEESATRGFVGQQMTTPFEELDAETPDLALAYVKEDSDGRVRSFPLWSHFNGADIPSLPALAVGALQKQLDGDENKAFINRLRSGKWRDVRGQLNDVPLNEIKMDDNRIHATPLHFYGPPATFATHSYAKVFQNSPQQLRRDFAGRIVFIGATAHILKDVFPMPAFQDNRADERRSEMVMPGVEMHATLAAQLLDGDFVRSTDTRGTLMALFALPLLASSWILLGREPISRIARAAQRGWARRDWPGRVHSLVWFALYALTAWLPLLAFWHFALWLFRAHGLWLPVIYPLLAGAIGASLSMLLLFVVEAGERRKAMAHFGRTVSRDVLEEMMATPEDDYLSPRRVDATVLFSDLEGFTTYSEEREPEEVVAALNAYMDRMVPIVHAHGGTVDKFIGDAIMAFFNAPIPRYDHAAQALLCAVALQDECARFRNETGIAFRMRIGVHGGPCLYGDVGSSGRSNVTVIGDTVNIASRLEGKNKDFGSWILCSQDTYEAAPGVVEAEGAQAQIKGKSHSVEVYLVRGPRGDPNRGELWSRLPQDDEGHELEESQSSDEIARELGGALPQLTDGGDVEDHQMSRR